MSLEKTLVCKNLNSVRANFTACCRYPLIVIERNYITECNETCMFEEEDDECCIYTCALEKNGMIYNVTNEDGSTSVDISSKAVVRSFMLSIGNEVQWVPVVTKSVQRCYDQFISASGFKCDGRIPMSLLDIIACSQIENFVKCPPWNPSNLKECEYTLQYLSECFDYALLENDS